MHGQGKSIQQGEGVEADECKQWLDAIVSQGTVILSVFFNSMW